MACFCLRKLANRLKKTREGTYVPEIFLDDVVKRLYIFLVVQGCHSVTDLENNAVVMFVSLQVKRQNHCFWIFSYGPLQFNHALFCILFPPEMRVQILKIRRLPFRARV